MTTTRKIQRYGWRKDSPDSRDQLFEHHMLTATRLPPVVDLRPKDTPIFDQGQLGSCTANAWVGLYQFMDKRQGTLPLENFSRLFLYSQELVVEGTPGQDNGAELRTGAKVLALTGVCPEEDWPYDISKLADTPPAKAFEDAKAHRFIQYYRMSRLAQMRTCLSYGYPFVFGFNVYESFESDFGPKWVMPMPGWMDPPIGGHAVMCVGYDDNRKVMIIRNSWGTDWGDKGYFYMPYDFISNPDQASDFWYCTKEMG